MRYLYHGSITQDIKVLEPHQRYTPQGKIDYAAIYATPLLAYAATHSFPWSTNEGVELNVRENDISLSVPANLKERLHVPVSIYKVSSEGFEHTKEELTGYTWHSRKPATTLEEIKYTSVEAALRELGVKLSYT